MADFIFEWDTEKDLDPAKALKREDVLPGFNPKKYSVLVHLLRTYFTPTPLSSTRIVSISPS